MAQQLRFEPGVCTLRLTRAGSLFKAAAYDKSGAEVGSQSVDLPELPAAGHVGMFVLSHDERQLSAAKFSELKFETPPTPQKPKP